MARVQKEAEVVESKFVESELYGGKVKVRFYPLSHQYWVSVNGSQFKRKRGSTSIIAIKDKSDALGKWQQQMTADFLLEALAAGKKLNEDLCLEACVQNEVSKEKATDIGHEMHAWIEKYINFKLRKKGFDSIPEMPEIPEAITGINGFLAWEKEAKPKYISSERMVYSMKHDYMGTLDVELKIDGDLVLGDFKSSNGLYNAVRMQTASYVMADQEENKSKKYKGRWVFRFSKYTEKEYRRREERKKVLKEKIATIRGKEFKDYDIPPYVAFEAKFLDKNKIMMQDDFENGFLACLSLTDWNARTDWYYNPEY